MLVSLTLSESVFVSLYLPFLYLLSAPGLLPFTWLLRSIILSSLITVIPDAVRQPLYVQTVEVFIRVESVHVVIQLVVIAVILLLLLLLLSLLLLVVVHVVHGIHLHLWVLLVILLHHLQVHLVVNLEALCLDFLLPVVVMNLHVVKDRVYKNSNVRVLV